jgi:aminoglycoside/choline kinase family phosphotransferase
MLSTFLNNILGAKDYKILDLPQDASCRKYSRIIKGEKSFILKTYNPSEYDPTDFIKITKILTSHNIEVPKIYGQDNVLGFMLIEDLGKQTVKDVLESESDFQVQFKIYKDVVDLLIALQKTSILELKQFHNIEVLMNGMELFINFFPTYLGINLSLSEKEEFLIKVIKIFKNFNFSKNSFVHRDFHVENILFDQGIYSLIDYQDASIGSPIYDLVSLTEDARIEVDERLAQEIVKYYCNKKQIDIHHIRDEYDILAMQRNLRILGVFSYHKVKYNNEKYIKYIPRTLKYLYRDLSNPILSDVLSLLRNKKIII